MVHRSISFEASAEEVNTARARLTWMKEGERAKRRQELERRRLEQEQRRVHRREILKLKSKILEEHGKSRRHRAKLGRLFETMAAVGLPGVEVFIEGQLWETEPPPKLGRPRGRRDCGLRAGRLRGLW